MAQTRFAVVKPETDALFPDTTIPPYALHLRLPKKMYRHWELDIDRRGQLRLVEIVLNRCGRGWITQLPTAAQPILQLQLASQSRYRHRIGTCRVMRDALDAFPLHDVQLLIFVGGQPPTPAHDTLCDWHDLPPTYVDERIRHIVGHDVLTLMDHPDEILLALPETYVGDYGEWGRVYRPSASLQWSLSLNGFTLSFLRAHVQHDRRRLAELTKLIVHNRNPEWRLYV